MTAEPTSHIEPSTHSTCQVDEILREVEDKVEHANGAGSTAIKPNRALADDGKPITDQHQAGGGA